MWKKDELEQKIIKHGMMHEDFIEYKKSLKRVCGNFLKRQPEYVKEISKDLMWMKLHIDSFCYTPELEDYYSRYMTSGEFSKAFIENEFRLAVANIVIALHRGNRVEAKEALRKAKEICKPDYSGKMYDILARHNYTESLKPTQEAKEFIKNIKI